MSAETMSGVRDSIQRLVNAIGAPLVHGSVFRGEYCCQQCQTIIVTFILKAFHTNIRIEIRELQGEVRASSLLCLLGIGLGLGSVLLYRIYSRVFPSPLSSLTPHAKLKQKRPTSSPKNKRPLERAMTHTEVLSPETPDSGISTGTTATLGSLSKEAPHENTQLVYSKGLRYRSPMGVPWKGRSPEAAGVQCGLSRSSSMPTYRDVYDEDIDVEPSLFDGRRYLLDNAKYSKRVVAEGFELHSDANGNAIYDEALDDIEESARHQQSRDYVAPLDTPTLKRKLAEFSIGDDLPRRRRNYSMCSDASASTNFSYRESLCSKGFSIDLGEALSDFADSEIYDVGSVSVRTESNMEDIQRELRQIRLEINEMNEAVTHLNSKEELVARQRYSLGTADVAEKDVAIWGHVRERLRSRDRSASVENLETHEGRQGYDFMWDYQCDLGTSAALLSRSEQSFLAKRPVFGSDMSLSDDNSTSLQSPCHLEHVRKYLETSPVHGSKVPQSQTNQSIAGIFIDDEYDAPTSAEKEKVRLVVGFQCNDSAQMPQQGIVTCTNCGHKAVPIMNASFSESMASSGIHSNYASESSLDTRHSLSVGSSLRSTSRSTDEISRSDTVLCAHPTSRWQVTNVEPKKNIYEYAETGLTVDGEKAANTKKGYHQVCQLLGMSQMRRVRSDNYCAIRAVLFQSLVNNMPILQHSGSLQQVLQKLSVFGDPKHSYLRSWTFANRLPYSKDSIAETIAECLKCLYEQAEALSLIHSYELREDYLLAVMNQSPELDLQLMEAIKALMMLRAITLYDLHKSQPRGGASVFAWLMFSRKSSETPELLFQNHVNTIGDTTMAGPVELFLLGHTLGLKIEVLRPASIGQESFISHYPDEGADGFPKVYLVSEDERHYNVVVP